MLFPLLFLYCLLSVAQCVYLEYLKLTFREYKGYYHAMTTHPVDLVPAFQPNITEYKVNLDWNMATLLVEPYLHSNTKIVDMYLCSVNSRCSTDREMLTIQDLNADWQIEQHYNALFYFSVAPQQPDVFAPLFPYNASATHRNLGDGVPAPPELPPLPVLPPTFPTKKDVSKYRLHITRKGGSLSAVKTLRILQPRQLELPFDQKTFAYSVAMEVVAREIVLSMELIDSSQAVAATKREQVEYRRSHAWDERRRLDNLATESKCQVYADNSKAMQIAPVVVKCKVPVGHTRTIDLHVSSPDRTSAVDYSIVATRGTCGFGLAFDDESLSCVVCEGKDRYTDDGVCTRCEEKCLECKGPQQCTKCRKRSASHSYHLQAGQCEEALLPFMYRRPGLFALLVLLVVGLCLASFALLFVGIRRVSAKKNETREASQNQTKPQFQKVASKDLESSELDRLVA
eukprot:Platyproteum_vivax@DN5931_c0_g1_i1.p1